MRPSILPWACAALFLAGAAAAQSPAVVRTDRYVQVKSTAPASAGQDMKLYVREVALPGKPPSGAAAKGKVVLFVHGAGTPAEVSFDIPYGDYSWMAYLAKAGFDVFSVDMTGYGRSSRPAPMADACNVLKASQDQLVPSPLPAPCPARFTGPITTMSSDWDDVGAAVDYVRKLRGVDQVALVGWSQGGPRTAGYAARNPGKVSKLVVLAPAYFRGGPTTGPAQAPVSADGTMTIQSEADFKANWDRQIGCEGQGEPAAYASVWSEMLLSDPVGAKWGKGVRRAPQVPTWGFNREIAAGMRTPFLMVSGPHDKQVDPQRVRELYADYGAGQKLFVDLACSSHNAMWEKNHLLLFQATVDWLKDGKVQGVSQGMLKLGY